MNQVSRVDEYRARLRKLKSWDAYLLRNSGLPGPRGNIELAQAVAEEGSPALFFRYLTYTSDRAPANSPREFLAFCGVLGLGRLLVEGDRRALPALRRSASDPRWRTREAVAMALQRLGDKKMDTLLARMQSWAKGNLYERRGAAAALCEPRLLVEPRHAIGTLDILDAITASVLRVKDRRSEDLLALRKGLGYCWSVAAAALPEEGLPRMERWMASADPDVRWIMRENLRKARLARVAPTWVRRWSAELQTSR